MADDATRYVLVAVRTSRRASGAGRAERHGRSQSRSRIAHRPGPLTKPPPRRQGVHRRRGKGQQIVSGLLGDPEQQSLSYEIRLA